jgi:hypothetical protein
LPFRTQCIFCTRHDWSRQIHKVGSEQAGRPIAGRRPCVISKAPTQREVGTENLNPVSQHLHIARLNNKAVHAVDDQLARNPARSGDAAGAARGEQNASLMHKPHWSNWLASTTNSASAYTAGMSNIFNWVEDDHMSISSQLRHLDTTLKIGRMWPRIETTRFRRDEFLRIGVIASQYMNLETGCLWRSMPQRNFQSTSIDLIEPGVDLDWWTLGEVDIWIQVDAGT